MALGDAGDGLHRGMGERAGGARTINAERVDAGLVAGGVGAGGIRRIGDDGIGALGGQQRHVRHVVQRQLAFELAAFVVALGKHACGGAVGDGKAVADEQDDVLRRRLRRRVVGVPDDALAAGAVAGGHRVVAGAAQHGVAQDQRRCLLAVLAGDQLGPPCQHLGVVLAIDGDLDPVGIDDTIELDLEIEVGTDQDVGAVHGIDRLGRGSERHGDNGGTKDGGQKWAHGFGTRKGSSHIATFK